jgi:hypothetical protein
MHRIDSAGNVGNQFTEGNPQLGQRATKVAADWLNDLQENVCQAIEGADIDLTKGDGGQLRAAIQAMITTAVGDISASPYVTQIAEGKWFHHAAGESANYKYPNGQALAAADYPALTAALTGNAALAADAADKTANPGKWWINGGNIYMPDLRGEFLRIWANEGAALDAGRALGAAQTDAIKNITGTFGNVTPSTSNGADPVATGAFHNTGTTHGTYSGAGANNYVIDFDASRQVNTASEVRPHNTAVYYLIRVK